MNMPTPRIRKDVPIPRNERDGRPGRPITARWQFLHTLEVGESAGFEFDDYDDLRAFRNLLNSNASRVGKREGKSFTVRTSEDRTEVSVWRTE